MCLLVVDNTQVYQCKGRGKAYQGIFDRKNACQFVLVTPEMGQLLMQSHPNCVFLQVPEYGCSWYSVAKSHSSLMLKLKIYYYSC